MDDFCVDEEVLVAKEERLSEGLLEGVRVCMLTADLVAETDDERVGRSVAVAFEVAEYVRVATDVLVPERDAVTVFDCDVVEDAVFVVVVVFDWDVDEVADFVMVVVLLVVVDEVAVFEPVVVFDTLVDALWVLLGMADTVGNALNIAVKVPNPLLVDDLVLVTVVVGRIC